MAECGRRALPILGEQLTRRLTEIENGFSHSVEAETIDTAARDVRTELVAWADRAFDHNVENEREMKEIIAALARAAESVGTRDQKYAQEIGGLTVKLRGIAALNNLGVIRRSIVESATEFRSCVEKMADDNKEAVRQLSAQVTEYRHRLDACERLSTTDPLTDLSNRRAFENQLKSRTAAARSFGLMMIDLDGFKSINDRYGHVTGDDLLRQFSSELRSHFAASEVVARWGGDEFAVLIDGDLARTDERAERVRRWVLGEYRISAGDREVHVTLSASIGAVEWNGSETGTELLARADALVYRCKSVSR